MGLWEYLLAGQVSEVVVVNFLDLVPVLKDFLD
jgi:hypothetical protein